MDHSADGLLRQHLIDPEICIRCNTCESTCPVGAISHDARNYVVDADKCNFCMACSPPCPTGSIDNWRVMPRERAYSVEAQFGWDVLPAEVSRELALEGAALDDAPAPPASPEPTRQALDASSYSAVTPPGRPSGRSPISMGRRRPRGRFPPWWSATCG
jgi:benzoyl-CoA 2,3-epoxidase subunit A